MIIIGTVQKELASSKENSTPPIGDPKAAAIPHADPAVIRSLYTLAYFDSSRIFPLPGLRWCTLAPMIAPICTIGPSPPHGIPPPIAKATPTAFTIRTIGRKIPF